MLLFVVVVVFVFVCCLLFVFVVCCLFFVVSHIPCIKLIETDMHVKYLTLSQKLQTLLNFHTTAVFITCTRGNIITVYRVYRQITNTVIRLISNGRLFRGRQKQFLKPVQWQKQRVQVKLGQVRSEF